LSSTNRHSVALPGKRKSSIPEARAPHA
jgi:hypothetical protein